MSQTAEPLVGRLTALGFSTYEARAYVGLLAAEPLTGYALANATGIPQPKVYEALRRLSEKGAAVKVADDPARFAALPPDRLLQALEASFRKRVDAAQSDFDRLGATGTSEWQEPLLHLGDQRTLRERAVELIDGARRKLYVTAWAEQLDDLEKPLAAADGRGVEVVLLQFGRRSPIPLANGLVYRHDSTAGMLYRSHRSRQLAVVADSAAALWGLSLRDDDWTGILSHDPPLVMVVKAYVRHDLFVQKIYETLGPEMHRAFGPALERLTDLAAAPFGDVAPEGGRAAG